MEEKNFILENEYNVNEVMLKIFKILLFMAPFVVVFKVLGIFIMPWTVVILMILFISILSGIPLLVFRNKKDKKIKLYTTLAFLVFSTITYSFVFVNGIFFMLVPSLIALLYFDTKLLKKVTISTIPLMMGAEFLASLSKQEFIANVKWIPIHFIAFSMQFSLILVLLLNLANRAKKMLNDTNNLFKGMSLLYENGNNASKKISEDVSELYENFNETNQTSKHVENSIMMISQKTEDFYEDIKNVVSDSKDILSDIEKIYEITSEMKMGTDSTEKQVKENLKSIVKIVEKFKEISNSTGNAKVSVNKLFDEIREIHKAIQLIEKIQKHTNVLSINASIEASKAGESGKGFAVVAGNIKLLAMQSDEYIELIKKQLNKVEDNSKDTVKKIDESYFYVEEGMKNLSSLEEFFDFIKNTLFVTSNKINNLNEKMNLLESKEKNIDRKIDSINHTNEEIVYKIIDIKEKVEVLNVTFDDNISLLKNIEIMSRDMTDKTHSI